MNPHYSAFIELGKALAREKDLGWEIPLDETGAALDGVGWNLTVAAGDVPPPAHYMRDLGTEVKALAIVNAERVERGLASLARRPLSTAWQDLVKAAVAEQLLFRRNTTGHIAQCIARPLRVIATCVDKEPWELTVDDLHVAVRVGKAIQATGKLGDMVVGIVKIVFDAQHICDAGPLYAALAVPRMKGKSAIKAKHTWSAEKLRDDLEARKRDERLPERRAFWELTRIVMTEQPRTFMDDLRFAAMRVLIVTGMRAGEVALLPVDWKRERTYLDSKGRPAGESGGISTSLMVRHFAEKQQEDETDSRVLREATQPVPEMFRTLLTETLDHVARITEPLRATLKLQCETGRLLPWYPVDSVVPVTEIYTRLMGNPFWLKIERRPFIERYRDGFDPAVLAELHEYQHVRRRSGDLGLDMAVYMFGNRLKTSMLEGKTGLRFRHGDGSQVKLLDRMEWHAAHLHVGELEEHIRLKTPTKVSDLDPLPLAVGSVQPWEFLFVHPKRSLAEERNDGLCDVTRYMSINRPDPTLIGQALGDAKYLPPLFEKYGQTDEDRALKIESHMLRHLQNTELFRLGVADTIISKRFNRRSVAQSYEYDHRSLAEDLEQIEIPQDIEIMLGAKTSTVARLIKGGKANGPIVDAFRRIQETDGDVAAYEYLRAEADGFHATPYGHCLNSFTVDPCPKHLECFADCRHLSATDLPEHRQNLVRLEGKFKLALESINARPSTSIGWKNQLDHAEKRLAGIQKLLATPAGEHPFPDGVDLSRPRQRGVLDD
ncbi:hypothetical protein [Paraburkholderia megapolitana]|uniref:Uncharacterized protein n=1 Tax=Paraburkholderia megapolitana TaxID=420953 RepID=A0A1I3WHM8_9BURK|nr:hypothetical protein [Paraburkholderia megapolitana]QDQ82212.1 hypothetical protein FNZ07_13000 [Paraburkholderia megapolitana]QDQ84038.1 hypothetical protein FNZ07_23185 [Paraburkholderia megapolitana]SFK06337.1 hypothetical protein SAMN05192543_1203 [Paraburkholderia megapolitana]